MPFLMPFSELAPIIKKLLWIHLAFFVLYFFNSIIYIPVLYNILNLGPLQSPTLFPELWRAFTYIFVHSSPLHFVANMLILWMMGDSLAKIWGARYFLAIYLGVGAFAALGSYVLGLFGHPSVVVGASGALFGLMYAYGKRFPDQIILLFFVFPVPMKYAIWILAAIDLLMIPSQNTTGISSITHVFGFLGAIVWFEFLESRLIKTSDSRYIRFPSKKELRARAAAPEGIEKYNEISALKREQDEVDRILRKMSALGEESLLTSEKQYLIDYSNKRNIQKNQK